MPVSAGVVHEAGKPRRPSISTRHRRQEPKGSRLSVAQSFGTFTSAFIAARMIEVPAGTVTCWPSISSVTCCAVFLSGVPKSVGARLATGEVLLEVLERAHHGIGSHAAHRAERSGEHRFVQVLEERDVGVA